jgi:hypothetical protein
MTSTKVIFLLFQENPKNMCLKHMQLLRLLLFQIENGNIINIYEYDLFDLSQNL